MTTSALSMSLETPPAPPPTSDLQVYTPSSPNTASKELTTSSNKCLLPVIESSGSVSKREPPTSVNNDFLPSELLFALKRHDKPISSPRRRAKFSLSPEKPQLSGKLKGVKAPSRLWGYSSRRGRLKHLTNAPPCICGAGKDISFLYDSPSERMEDTKQVRRRLIRRLTMPPIIVGDETWLAIILLFCWRPFIMAA